MPLWHTHASAVLAGLISEMSPYSITYEKHPHHSNGYLERSVLATSVLGWDAVRAHGVDMMHQAPNFARTLIHTMANVYSGTYTVGAHRYEMRVRNNRAHVSNWRPGVEIKSGKVRAMPRTRSEGKEEKVTITDEDEGEDVPVDGVALDPISDDDALDEADRQLVLDRQPWQLTKSEQLAFDRRCGFIRLPYRDQYFPTLFSRDKPSDYRIKSAHWFVFLGPVGVWLMLGCTSLAPVILDLLCDAIWWCHRLTAKTFEQDELSVLDVEGQQLFARLELLLPLRTATIARHYLSHAVHFIREFGPLHTQWQ